MQWQKQIDIDKNSKIIFLINIYYTSNFTVTAGIYK